MSSHNRPTLEQRIEDLERQNRRLGWWLLLAPVAALLLGAGAAEVKDWKGKSVTAEKFILVDADGKERAAVLLTGKDGEPALELYNKDHTLLLNAGKSEVNGVGFIQFFDGSGKFKGGVGGNSLK
jgi:hypothetical protein